MTIFWLGAAVMIVAGLGWILPAFWSREAIDAPTRDDHAVQVYEARMAELEIDQDEGVIDPSQLETARNELAAELIRDVRDDGLRPSVSRSALASSGVVALAVAGLAVGSYQFYGTPEGLGISGKGPTRAQAQARAAAMAQNGSQGQPQNQAQNPAQNPAQSQSQNQAQSPTGGSAGDGTAMPSVEQMVSGLSARLEANPDDGKGWMMLGRSYQVMGDLPKAQQALEKALDLLPNEPDALSAYAEVLGRQNDNQLNGRPAQFLEAALTANPSHPKSLWLSGIAAMQQADGAGAINHWEALKMTGALNAEETKSIDLMIADARGITPGSQPAQAQAPATTSAPSTTATVAAQSASAGGASSGSAPASSSAAAGGVSITVRVSIDEALAARLRPSDSLFVFARAEQGPPMPLAVQRLSASDLPATVVLDESMAMMPQMTLGTFPRVVIGARVSRSGNATPSAGDLQGMSEGLAPSETGEISLVIKDVL
jgi:cytochrome c-type biogenesis protein CcmH